jgi:peptidoglycan/xylan/chitin deacetylase (PgdA/CDA1 family)
MKKLLLLPLLLCALLLVGIHPVEISAQDTELPHTPFPPRRSPLPKLDNPPKKEPHTTRTATASIVSTSLPSPETIALPYPTPILVYHPAGEVKVPILMYHHVADTDETARYSVSLQEFEKQISSLRSWGYTAIPISLLAQAIEQGADLPLRPVVITFDDGYRDVYQNALPVMERYGYTATVYVIVKQIGVGGYMNTKHLKELVARGWEVGSHSETHSNLRKTKTKLDDEIFNSRLALEELLSTPVLSFSYPYGSATPALLKLVQQAGYRSGVGVGSTSRHTPKSKFYLSRLEVEGSFDLVEFARLLR